MRNSETTDREAEKQRNNCVEERERDVERDVMFLRMHYQERNDR